MSKQFLSATFLIYLFATTIGFAQKPQSSSDVRITKQWIDQKLKGAAKQFDYFATQIPEGLLPRSFTNNTLRTCTSDKWVAGFYPGTALFLAGATDDKALYDEALKKVKLMKKEAFNTGTHDLGFMMFCSYGNFYKLHL